MQTQSLCSVKEAKNDKKNKNKMEIGGLITCSHIYLSIYQLNEP